MKKDIIYLSIIIILVGIIVSMYNTTISWEHDGKMWSYKLGHFYTEKVGIRHE